MYTIKRCEHASAWICALNSVGQSSENSIKRLKKKISKNIALRRNACLSFSEKETKISENTEFSESYPACNIAYRQIRFGLGVSRVL
jgi:hypothetical protein